MSVLKPEQQETADQIPGKTGKLPSPTAKADGVQERAVPIARKLQIVEGAADVFQDTQREVLGKTTEPTSLCAVEKSAATPPYMQVTIEDVLVQCGQLAKFDAIIEGNPQPTVSWFKGISLLTDGERVRQLSEGTRYSLILYNTRAEDGGVYTCLAKNAGGEVLCKAELVVQEDKRSQEAKKPITRRKLHSFYEVKQEIARGSFGFLKRVVHKETRTVCAAKFIPLRSKTRDRAYRERVILAALSHDRITRLLDDFETRKTLILILELCSNEELLDRLYRKNMVTEAEIKLYIKQLLEGIAYIHENKILHLDIKPSNILMVYDNRDDIKICDFGFAQKIIPNEPQYSKYGSPEFVSPEILSQSPVSMASDIWPVGVISYLSLTCKSPFAGENDRETLQNIQNGAISWDIPGFVNLSEDGKDFIGKILQQSAEARPGAGECLSHRWFVNNLPPEEAHLIDTKQLKFFVSRSKWQRSLMSYKSVLVMRPIPDILEKTQKNTSLGIARQLVEDSSSTSSSGSSSDNEVSAPLKGRQFGPIPELHLSVLDGSRDSEFPQSSAEGKYSVASPDLPGLKVSKHKPVSGKGEPGDQPLSEPVAKAFIPEVEGVRPERKAAHPLGKGSKRALQPEAGKREIFPPQEKDSLLLPEEGKIEPGGVGRSPGCVPRHSVIKSTFGSQPSETLANVPSSPGKEHRKHLERAKRTYRKAGYPKSALSGLREPLLEQFEFGDGGGGLLGEEETGKNREGGIGPLTKSASFDTAQRSPRVTFEVSSRSRSLDDYRTRAASFAEEQFIEEEDSELIPQGSPVEKAHQGHISQVGTEKTPAKEGSEPMMKGYSQEQPALLAQPGDRQSSIMDVQEQGMAFISTQQPGKEESLLWKSKPPISTKRGAAVLEGEGMILTPEQSEFTLASAKKNASDEPSHQTSQAPVLRGAIPVPLKGESSRSEIIPVVSQDGEGASHLPHETKPTSVLQSSQRPEVLQGESPDFVKPAPVPGTFKSGALLPQMPSVQGEHPKVDMAKGKSTGIQQTAPVGDSQPLSQPVTQEDKISSIQISRAGTSGFSAFEGKDQKILPQKPSATSLTETDVLAGKGPVNLTISQEKTIPFSISERVTQKLACQTPAVQDEMFLVIPGEGPICIDTVPIWDLEEEEMLQKKPSEFIEVVSSVLRSAHTTSQEEIAASSLSAGESHKGSPPLPSIHGEAKHVLSEKKSSPQQSETIQTLIHEGQRHEQLHQKSLVPSERKPEVLEGEEQPLKGVPRPSPVLISAGESPECEEYLIQSEEMSAAPEGKSPHILMSAGARVTPVSSFGTENQEFLYCIPPDVSEVKPSVMRSQRPSSSASSQAEMVPFSVSERESMAALRKAPVRVRESVHQKPSVYSEAEAKALESLVDEMVTLSHEMNVLAESVADQEGSKRHFSPPREIFQQGPPGQALRPTSRYLVRRGKREGGIGLADPSEADVIYPDEYEYFSMPPSMSKKARMAPPYEGRGLDDVGMEITPQFTSSDLGERFYYSGSDRSYEIALVQIQDLWDDMPRPDSKTAKFDISEVEPAFLNLHELYDIVYYPFEFLSFRKAPEKLPSKRRLPSGEKAKMAPGLKVPSHQDKKMHLREDDTTREASRDQETPALKSVGGSEGTKAPRIGKRSDSEGDLPAGSPQMYDPTGKRRSSLQSRLGAFKPFVRSQSMDQLEQSLKKKMKASVAHFSRMLTRKPSPDQRSRAGSEERRGDLQERDSLTEVSGTLKKKSRFPSFTLPSLKTKEKAPSFVEELTDQTIASGQSVTLSCRTSAHSSPHVEWFKDGAAIRSTDRILISSTLKNFQLLTILAATKEDFGTYACVATNSQGTVSTSCVIRKAEAPSNPPPPDIVEILEDGVQLAWKPVELHTPVTYTVLCRKEDGEWKTLASDISNCCYTAGNLPWGLVCSFRIACVSKAGVGPYSNPTAQVKIGEKDQTAFQSPEMEDSKMTAATQPTHQTYAFQTEIKRGRFSIIKQCREKLSGNALAAKIVPYRAEDKELVLQEYQILSKLQHTNIGQLQGAYVSPRHLVLILELCVGPELLHALAGRSSYSEVEVRDYLWQILSAVEFLHSQNILHLDLRSENMVITEPNLLKLLDFGNAQFFTPDRVITLDGCTDYVETMASELLSDKGAVPQTDIWAVGVTAFIMLSAEYPISSEAACDFGRLVKREKIKLNKCYAGLSGGAVSFLQSTLSSNPWRRPTASECLQSLWLQETGLDERQLATVTFSTTKLRNFVAERERKRALLCSKYGVMTV